MRVHQARVWDKAQNTTTVEPLPKGVLYREVHVMSLTRALHLFIPIFSMAEAGGPMNSTPVLLHSSENCLFSDRKPYPGWIAYRK